MADVSPADDKRPSRPKPRLNIGFLDLAEIPDSVFFEPMTEEELAEWEWLLLAH